MPAQKTPRNHCGDARIDLDGQFDDLVEIVDTVENLDAAWQQFKARFLRSASKANRARHQAIGSIDLAQSDGPPWDGKRERRSSDRRRRVLPDGGAAAEIVAFQAAA